MPLTAIFDIGKTNKKFFLFDEEFREVYRSYEHFREVDDDDGFPADDLSGIAAWMEATLHEAFTREKGAIRYLNFSTYGATLVHLDAAGRPATPLYNYLKPFPGDLLARFYQARGGRAQFVRETASPPLGMLNSGLQLYWLREVKPEAFARVQRTLHFPQYCSFLFGGKPVSDFTSIGCHTALWDFDRGTYHSWLEAERLDKLLAPVIAATANREVPFAGGSLVLGTGVHDSSAALLPYLWSTREPFLLLSTGTWSIALNPFDDAPLTAAELEADCLKYLSADGRPVKASRLFLGREYETQVSRLGEHFGREPGYEHSVAFDEDAARRSAGRRPRFHWEHLNLAGLPSRGPAVTDLSGLDTFEEAYHQLMTELVDRQLESLRLARGRTPVGKVFIDGGFAANELYLSLLARALPEVSLLVADASLGSALGAALCVAPRPGLTTGAAGSLPAGFLEKNYKLRNFA